MKQKKEMRKKGKEQTPQGKIYYPLLYLQALLTVGMLGLGIATLFQNSLLNWFELVLGITLLDIALNNSLMFKRNGGTLLYSVVGIILIVLAILAFLGV